MASPNSFTDAATFSSPNKRNSQESATSEEELTPRKRPRLSFWKSKRVDEATEDDTPVSQDQLCELKELQAGVTYQAIKIRVICKQVREKILKIVVMDSTGERVVKAFGPCIDQFKHLKINQVYKIHNFQVTGGFRGSEDEIILQKASNVEEIDDQNFAEIPFEFIGLDALCDADDKDIIDTVGIVTEILPPAVSGKGTPKREVIITDASKSEICVVFWGKDMCLVDDIELYTPVIFRFATKKGQGIYSELWVSWKTQIMNNPNHVKATELLNWFREETAAEEMDIE